MNKPMGTGAARLEPPAPVVLVPKPAPAAPANAHRRNVWLIAGLLSLAVLVAVGVVWWLTTSGATVRYTTAAVSRGAVTRAVTATGTVNPVLTIIVGTYVSGVIQDLQCDYNTEVKRGQICATIGHSHPRIVEAVRRSLGEAVHLNSGLLSERVLALAERIPFDLLVSDVGLPDGNGLELMQRLQKMRPMPGIAMSGFGMDEDIARSREAGFAEHLTKPISIARLEEAIQKITRGGKLQIA